jgi:NAD-dependent dihydropyrimidine dehydrogenase PreA subunit
MTSNEKKDRGVVKISLDECKGCSYCVEACPAKLLSLSEGLSHNGYRAATYVGSGCTAGGICYMVCPEPGAITVYRLAQAAGATAHVPLEGAAECRSN